MRNDYEERMFLLLFNLKRRKLIFNRECGRILQEPRIPQTRISQPRISTTTMNVDIIEPISITALKTEVITVITTSQMILGEKE